MNTHKPRFVFFINRRLEIQSRNQNSSPDALNKTGSLWHALMLTYKYRANRLSNYKAWLHHGIASLVSYFINTQTPLCVARLLTWIYYFSF